MSNLAPTAVSAAGVVTGTAQPTVNGLVTVLGVNTSSFIGTVFLETSLDGGMTYIRPATPLTSGTMGTGPFTYSFNINSPGPAVSVLHRLNCSAYTSGTATFSITEAATPNVTLGQGGLDANNRPVNVGSFLGTQTNDSATAGEVGEYLSNMHGTVSATGIADAGANGPPVASPVVCTLTAWDTGNTFGNLQSVFLTGTVGTGLVANTNYFVCNFNPSTLTFNLASTLAKAVAAQNGTGAPDMNVTVVGSGTTTYHQGSYATSTSANDIMGMILTPGDWDVEANVFAVYVSSASVTKWQAWLAQVGASSAPTTAATIFAQGAIESQTATANTANTTGLWTLPTVRVSVPAAGAYVALAYNATFSVAQVNPQGFIRARRVR